MATTTATLRDSTPETDWTDPSHEPPRHQKQLLQQRRQRRREEDDSNDDVVLLSPDDRRRRRRRILRSSTVLVDDDARNVRIARGDGYATIRYEPGTSLCGAALVGAGQRRDPPGDAASADR
jgi:hypothetical protein